MAKAGVQVPSNLAPASGKAYRFVNNPPVPNDCLPVAKLRGQEHLPVAWGISLFNTRAQAARALRRIQKKYKNSGQGKDIGDHIAELDLDPAMGMITSSQHSTGHFTLYEAAGCNLLPHLRDIAKP